MAVKGAAGLGAVLVVAGLVEVLQVRLQQDGHPAGLPQRYQEVDLERIHLLRIAKCHVRLDKDSAAPAHRTWLGYSPMQRKQMGELNMTVSPPGLTSRTISSVTSEPAASSKKGKRASSTDLWVGN